VPWIRGPQNSRYGTPDPFDGKAIWTTQIGGDARACEFLG